MIKSEYTHLEDLHKLVATPNTEMGNSDVFGFTCITNLIYWSITLLNKKVDKALFGLLV